MEIDASQSCGWWQDCFVWRPPTATFMCRKMSCRHTSWYWGNMTGTEKGLPITSPLSYLFQKPLLWSVNVSSGTAATTEQVILPHPLQSPSCPQFKTSQCPNRIDPNLNPTLQPFLSSEESHCLLPNMHWRLSMKEEMLDRRQRKRIRAWAGIRYSLIYNWQCFSV